MDTPKDRLAAVRDHAQAPARQVAGKVGAPAKNRRRRLSLRIPICAEWRCSCGEIGFAARACPAPSPSQAGPTLMRVCRPLPSCGGNDRYGGGRQGRNQRCALRGGADARSPYARSVSDAPKLMRPDQRAAPAFSGQSAAISGLSGGDYTASPSNTALHRSWMLAERAFGQSASV